MQSGLAEFLIKSVLDTGFRELALSYPDRAFEGFDLSTDEKDILRSGDERVLGLLGRVLQYSWPVQPATSNQKPLAESTTPSTQTLPEVALRLRFVPYAAESPDARLQFNYEASLHPWTDDPATEDRSVDDSTAAANAAFDMMIRIVPTVISLAGTEPKVAYAATIQSPGSGTGPGPPLEPGGSYAGTTPASRYHGNSLAAREAAAAVGQAEPNQRYARIFDLIRALRQGDDNA